MLIVRNDERIYGLLTEVKRYLLNQQPGEFMNCPAVAELLNSEGPDGLPAILINDQIVKKGDYPTLEEMREYIRNEGGNS